MRLLPERVSADHLGRGNGDETELEALVEDLDLGDAGQVARRV